MTHACTRRNLEDKNRHTLDIICAHASYNDSIQKAEQLVPGILKRKTFVSVCVVMLTMQIYELLPFLCCISNRVTVQSVSCPTVISNVLFRMMCLLLAPVMTAVPERTTNSKSYHEAEEWPLSLFYLIIG